MECSCSISANVDDYDYSEIMLERWFTARKLYKCHECFRKIQKGEKYYKEVSLDDGYFSAHRTCSDCKSIRDHLMGDFYWGQIREMIQDYIYDGNEIPEKCIAKLTPAAMDWVCEKIESTWEEDDDI